MWLNVMLIMLTVRDIYRDEGHFGEAVRSRFLGIQEQA